MLFAARATELWHFSISLGLLCGLFGMAATFAPMASDISHWFTARRGFALGIVISGTYVAGAVWLLARDRGPPAGVAMARAA